MPHPLSVLIVAHGSSRYADAARPAMEHAGALRHRFAAVEVGLLAGYPTVADALARLPPGPVRVVPFFMEDGYFVRSVIPPLLPPHAALGEPVGTHPSVADIAAALVPSDASDLVLIAHGSARNPGRRLAAHTHTETLRHRFGSARLGFLEEAPFAADVLRAARGDKVAVVGMFAGEGGHPSDDLPALLAHSPRLLWAGSIGAHPAMADLIADRATSAGRRLP